MKRLPALCVIAAFCLAEPARAETRTLCLTVLDASSGEALVDIGPACDERVTPASTFKLAISLMGFDAGVLKSPEEPRLPFEEGYVDWRPEWRQATTPATWMRDSVVWYSQRVMERLGRERVIPVEKPSLGAEDFAELLRDVPGMMLRLGVAGPDGCAPLHNGAFALDERSLGVGIEVLAATLMQWISLRVR